MRAHRIDWLRCGIAAFALVVSVSSADAGALSGVVRTRTRPDTPAAAAVVYAELIAVDGRKPAAAGAARAVTLTQKHKTFQPQTIVAPVGSTIAFPNNDPIFHNVFSLSGPQPFDLGLYRAGQARTRTFQQPGIYRVFCNIHPEMTALVAVVPTPYTAQTDADGRYTLDLPPGRYRITALSPRAAAVSVEADVVSGQAPEIVLDESAWTSAPHKNKYGQDYPAASYQR